MTLPSPELDQQRMRRALELAEATVALASPNPQVGCVLTRPGPSGPEILGEGAHRYAQRDHAEIVALQHARVLGHTTRGATAYVTLEPCAHHGRTPPCADALIAAGVARVVVATVDPNPLVAGQGLARLRAAGVEVHVGTLEAEARAMIEAWAFSMLHGRPCVTLKAALSADGFLAPAPHTRSSAPGPVWLTGPAARAHVGEMRHASDAILTGIGTVLADDPLLTDRTGLPRRRPLLRVVLDPLGRTPLTSALAHSADRDLLLLLSHEAPPERIAALRRAGAFVHVLPTAPPSSDASAHRRPRLDLHAALTHLHQLGSDDGSPEPIRSLLLEAGPTLNGAFFANDLVDRLALFHSTAVLGPGSLPFADGLASPADLEQRLTRLTRREFHSHAQPDMLVSGTLHDPWLPSPSTPETGPSSAPPSER